MKSKTIDRILQHIVDHPGVNSAEIADALDIDSAGISGFLRSYIDDGRVSTEKGTAPSGREVNRYFPGQSLIREIDGVKQIVSGRQPAGTRAALRAGGLDISTADPNASFACGLLSNGQLMIMQQRRSMTLARDETARLIAYLDSINIDSAVAPSGEKS
ncbi:TPA: MarR family transcriptional regulator [Burkholderia stabilis]|nr:MarR family transcriptional regulator [Burkholderia stabilis]HDR9589130.1 MarR family transcriptional regulator [Burkholderia stabilis]HDR9649526.1 MarR family transcriptional regulator [Burkholderia stabilis]HDR9653592.1 MarR family transcriptional regulator [Burkholderia stabilis]HDR9656287.1 MarR family transcriptional regulator [Burkholderia stabilis]